jgi:hypothetical protein
MTKPSRLKMNLQFFSEGEPIETIEPTDPPESVETNEPTDPPTNTTETTELEDSFLEIKYNKEQIRLDKERAAELAQKGMNYDKAVERAKQEARDTYIAEQGYEWNGKPIATEAEYKRALKEKEMYENLQSKDLPDEVIQELIEGRNFREQSQAERKSSEEKVKQEADYQAFLDTFPDTDPKGIPQSVWSEVEKGKSLVDAYTKFENQTLKQQLEDLKKGKEIEQQNAENAQSSTGAINNKGDNNQAYFTREQVAKMSTEEVNKHWKTINESMKKWK